MFLGDFVSDMHVGDVSVGVLANRSQNLSHACIAMLRPKLLVKHTLGR